MATERLSHSQLTKPFKQTQDLLNKPRASEDVIAGWHYRCNRHELGQTSGNGEGQRGLAAAVHGVPKSRTPLGD